jgi:hypothetical protein
MRISYLIIASALTGCKKDVPASNPNTSAHEPQAVVSTGGGPHNAPPNSKVVINMPPDNRGLTQSGLTDRSALDGSSNQKHSIEKLIEIDLGETDEDSEMEVDPDELEEDESSEVAADGKILPKVEKELLAKLDALLTHHRKLVSASSIVTGFKASEHSAGALTSDRKKAIAGIVELELPEKEAQKFINELNEEVERVRNLERRNSNKHRLTRLSDISGEHRVALSMISPGLVEATQTGAERQGCGSRHSSATLIRARCCLREARCAQQV